MIGVLAVGVLIGIAISEALEPNNDNVISKSTKSVLCDCRLCNEED